MGNQTGPRQLEFPAVHRGARFGGFVVDAEGLAVDLDRERRGEMAFGQAAQARAG